MFRMLGGGFNNVLRPEETEGGSTAQIQEYGPFADCVESCELDYMRSMGHFFTWSNGTIRSKIDRTLINLKWMELFP